MAGAIHAQTMVADEACTHIQTGFLSHSGTEHHLH